jgi:hypothetical protein
VWFSTRSATIALLCSREVNNTSDHGPGKYTLKPGSDEYNCCRLIHPFQGSNRTRLGNPNFQANQPNTTRKLSFSLPIIAQYTAQMYVLDFCTSTTTPRAQPDPQNSGYQRLKKCPSKQTRKGSIIIRPATSRSCIPCLACIPGLNI